MDKTPQNQLITFFNPLAAVNEANTRPLYTTLTGLCLTFLPASTVRVAPVSLPLLHLTSTVIPPRTRAPRMDPDGHCAGRAGRRVMVSGEVMLATSGACKRPFCDGGKVFNLDLNDQVRNYVLTMTAAGNPKLASIWKIGSGSKGLYKLNKLGPKFSLIAY
jgi:hypothetical protein